MLTFIIKTSITIYEVLMKKIKFIVNEILIIGYAAAITAVAIMLMILSMALINTVFGQTVKEKRVKIAVIDTGIRAKTQIERYLCADGHKDFTGTGLVDRDGHGTNIAGIIAKKMDPKKQCIVIIKSFDPLSKNSTETLVNALKWAQNQNVKFVNYSGGGAGKNLEEESTIGSMLNYGVTVIVAAGNDSKNLSADCYYYPACYAFKNKNFYVVGNGQGIYRSPSSNWGGPITNIENGENVEGEGIILTGTSQATAVMTGKLIKSR
jgi:subtilisin family serine protease